MSESYFFHTLQEVAIEQQNNQVYIISRIFDDEGFIKFVSYESGTVEKIIGHTSELKSLGVAYLFDDKILIENEIIPSSLDFETAVLHESVVLNAALVDELDGDTGFQPQKIVYCHYFKDKTVSLCIKLAAKSWKNCSCAKITETEPEKNHLRIIFPVRLPWRFRPSGDFLWEKNNVESNCRRLSGYTNTDTGNEY